MFLAATTNQLYSMGRHKRSVLKSSLAVAIEKFHKGHKTAGSLIP